MMNLLIDTASSRVILAVLEGNKIIYQKNVENDTDLSSKIFPYIDELFQKSKLLPQNIDRIYVVNGPGSFTGIRIGVTVAKTMAWALKKEIVPISELELMATTPIMSKYKVPFIDARRDAVFAAIYDMNGKVILEEQYISIKDLLTKIPDLQDVAFLGYSKISIEYPIVCPNIDLTKVISDHQRDASLNPHEVNPNYLKKTEAEENLARHHD